MLGFSRWQIFKGLAMAGGIMSIVSLALLYFIPAPPSKVTMATGFKGSSIEYYGRQYRQFFARFNVELELRESAGAVENVSLLQDPTSGVQIALVVGGVSDGKHTPGVLSLGTVYHNPFWIFYSSNEWFDRLSQLKGKRIAVGPIGSATRLSAEQILGKGGVNSETATLLPFAGSALEASFDNDPMDKHLAEKQVEIERIEDAVSHTRFPLTFSDQVYNLRGHIDIVRRKIASRVTATGRMAAE